MRADFWLSAFCITFCIFSGYTKEGKDKCDKAGWRSRGSGIGVWIFLFYPLPLSLWGYQKAGKVWGSQREAKALKPPVKLLPSVAISHEVLAMPCSSHSEGASAGRWPSAMLPAGGQGWRQPSPAPWHQAGGSPSSACIWQGDQCPGIACASEAHHSCCT